MRTCVPAETWVEFENHFTLHNVMPILIKRYGTKLASEIERDIYNDMVGKADFKSGVRYPEF